MDWFTKQRRRWVAWQDMRWEQLSKLDKKYRAEREEYVQNLSRLRRRLTKNALRFFQKMNLHDASLCFFNIHDLNERRYLKGKCFRKIEEPTCLELKLLSFTQTKIHHLRYTKVRRVQFDFPSEHELFITPDNISIGEWAYDRLTVADRKYLRHEILFDSGAILAIEFRKFFYSEIEFKGKGKKWRFEITESCKKNNRSAAARPAI